MEVAERDIFCEIVKVSYGKGAKNPVSGPTAFYEPKKPLSQSPIVMEATAETGTQETEEEWAVDMREQNKHWSVGVVPQGECAAECICGCSVLVVYTTVSDKLLPYYCQDCCYY